MRKEGGEGGEKRVFLILKLFIPRDYEHFWGTFKSFQQTKSIG